MTISSSRTVVRASASDVTCPKIGWRSALSSTRSTSTRAGLTSASPATGPAMAARSATPSSARSALIVPRTHEVTARPVVVWGSST
ncbi:Uncharacterised protein [Mycobacterium tuberculosis]|nr:Uncharacterised protein [Mycobacterium tuberculosis]